MQELSKLYRDQQCPRKWADTPARIMGIDDNGTQLALHFIHDTFDMFDHIAICVKRENKPMYKFLEEKSSVTIYEETVPPMSELDRYGYRSLIIFDACNESHLAFQSERIIEYVTRCRRKGIKMMYLTQSYGKTLKFLRLQMNIIIMRNLSTKSELELIYSEHNTETDLDTLIELSERAITNKKWLTINTDENKIYTA